MKYVKITIFAIASLLLASTTSAQIFGEDSPMQSMPIDFTLQLKTKHLWRGIQVSNSALAAVDLGLKTNGFGVGVWTGASFDGDFREFDYYLSYENSGFQIALWDIYNFSPGATYNNEEIFNYKAHETGHFIDLSIGYRFQGDVPLFLGWATIIHGRDRGSENNNHNLYSTYVSADYPVIRNKPVDINLGLAAAFALNKEDGTSANFYGHKAGIVNVNITASKVVRFGNFSLPVSAMVMWNPVENHANLQLAMNIF